MVPGSAACSLTLSRNGRSRMEIRESEKREVNKANSSKLVMVRSFLDPGVDMSS